MSAIQLSQTAVNGFTSMMRNVFSTSSIGLAAMTFSKNFKRYIVHVRIVAYCIFIYSIIYGIKAARDFNKHLIFIEKTHKLNKEDIILIDQWKSYDNFAYLYIAILVIFIIIMLAQDISYHLR